MVGEGKKPLDKVVNWDCFRDSMLHRNHFPNSFVLTLLQVAIQFFHDDAEVSRGFEGRLQEKVSDRHAEFEAEMMGIRNALIAEMREYSRKSTKEEIGEIREPTTALGTPAPRS